MQYLKLKYLLSSFFIFLSLINDSFAETFPEMKLIPAGEFQIGSQSDGSMPNEKPVYPVKIASFLMDETPVTNL